MFYNKPILIILMCISTLLFSQSITQKRADTPKDKPIQIKIHNGATYCYSPYFTSGNGYLYISDCKYATPARFDVFQRVSWKVNGNWMCMSAPSSVTGIEGTSNQEWDYILIKPCAINDPNQRWIILDNSFYTADKKFKIKDYKWFGFISKDSKTYYDHNIDTDAMKTWINTIALPGNISTKTFVGWSYVSYSPPMFAVYYLQNNASYVDDVKELYYNPENGHIAQFDNANGYLYCMTSKQNKKDDWNWIYWDKCDDSIPTSKDNKYWEFSLLNDNEGALRDKDGNFLRVTQYGPNWGVPYTAKQEYLSKDSTNSPKSLFVFSKDIDRWNRYVDANLSDSLQFCPAPGNKATQVATDNKRNIRSLPPEFRITDDWISRFWQISTTTTNDPQQIDALSWCGTCLLHSYQMLAELQEYYMTSPLNNGGYFFNTAPNMDISPFTSFINRFPILANRIQGTIFLDRIALSINEDITQTERRMLYTTTLLMLPNYNFYISPTSYGEIGIRNAIRELFNRPVGTLWVFGLVRTSQDGRQDIGHSQIIIRVPQGLMFVPTNTYNATLDEYRNAILNNTVRDEIGAMDILTMNRTRAALRFFTIELLGPQQASINYYLSNNNCSGLGGDRRGNTQLPLSATINQCASGRCGF